MVHTTGNELEQKQLDEIRATGAKTYSISRLNSANQCLYGYHQTYNKRERGKDSCYGIAGSHLHDMLEEAYRDKSIPERAELLKKFNTMLFKLEIQELDFPNDKIKDSFTADLVHFITNFELTEGEFELEKMYIAEFDGNYLFGYIDAIKNDEGKLSIIDYKTSTKFAGKEKLKHAGRQLVIYKLGLEQQGKVIESVSWNMLKYCYMCKTLKNGKLNKKMVNRGKLFKDMKANFEKIALSSGMSDLQFEIEFEKAEKANDFNQLPQCILDVYWMEDAMLEYDVTEEVENETKEYIKSTISMIESLDPEDESQWTALDVEKENFFCNTLCNHRATCKFLKEWKQANPFKKVGF